MNSVKLQNIKLTFKKSVTFLYINNKFSKKEINKLSIYNRIKPLGINLNDKVKDLYSEKYKTLIKEMEEDIINGKVSSVDCRIHMLKDQPCQKSPSDSI